MFPSIYIANRGEIARRIQRTCRRLGIATAVGFSEADVEAPFVRDADAAFLLGPAEASRSYLDIAAVLAAAKASGAHAIHPGYGFLAENAAFADACQAAGFVFIGPSGEAMRRLGDKKAAKVLAATLGVPIARGYHGDEQDVDILATKADEVGFPLLIKAAGGGGGKGMRVVAAGAARAELMLALEQARREAERAFGDPRLLLEPYFERPRHIEIQVIADRYGKVLPLGERECSLQRRHQKILEETPAPGLAPSVRDEMAAAAVRLVAATGYVGVATVEFLLLADQRFLFLEVNTRLQVEHPVTEEVTGIDLVEEQLRVAAGEPLRWDAPPTPRGHAVEVRLCAEDPWGGHLPQAGRLHGCRWGGGAGVRWEIGIEAGGEIGSYYDSMFAKAIAMGSGRAEALRRLHHALVGTELVGVVHNRSYLVALVERLQQDPMAPVDTQWLEREFFPQTVSPPLEEFAAALSFAASSADPEQTRPAWRLSTAGVVVAPPPLRLRCGATESEFLPRWHTQERLELAAVPRSATVGSSGSSSGDSTSLSPTGAARATQPSGPPDSASGDGHGSAPRVWRRLSGAAGGIGLGSGSTVFLDPAGRRCSWAVTPDDGEIRQLLVVGGHVWIGEWRVEVATRFPLRGQAGHGDALRAPMPGRVVRVLVAPGDEVVAGQPLVVLEAMKMEHTVKAAHPGRIAEVLVQVGLQVTADAALVALE